MKLEIQRYAIHIIPESAQDAAYIEEVLGLRSDKDQAVVSRVNAHNLLALAYIEVTRKPEAREER